MWTNEGYQLDDARISVVSFDQLLIRTIASIDSSSFVDSSYLYLILFDRLHSTVRLSCLVPLGRIW